jgi:hypothetical protein
MKIKSLRYIILAPMVFSLSIEAQQTRPHERTNSISLNPKQCVALTKGNSCYLDISLSWTAVEKGEYCLYSSQEKAAVKCWQDEIGGVFEGEITLKDNVSFSLKTGKSDILLSSVELEMLWVYKNKQRSHSTWRMF